MLAAKILFWTSIFLILYPHIFYPVLIALFARFFPQFSELKSHQQEWPSVTFIISAFNEEEVISEKIENALKMDYPADKLLILVVSDACDDRTDQIVEEWQARDNRVSLLRQNQRRGKTMGLNAALANASSEVVAFSDANAMYEPGALKELVKYFAQPEVGYVVGAALYNQDRDSGANQSEDLYWNMELKLKKWESDFYSVVGGDGAIYAIRRELFWELEEDDINDFVNPLQIVAHGYQGVFNPYAICYEDTATEFSKEFKRKRRIVNRSWRGFRKNLGRFSLVRHGKFLFELFSHKVIRWLAMIFIGTAMLSSGLLTFITQDLTYSLAFLGLSASILVALIGQYMDSRNIAMPKIMYLCYYFYFVNYAAILGIIDNLKGVRHITWDHVRGEK